MTNREFFNAIAKNGNVSTDLRDFAINEIEKLDARNEKRKNTKSKAQVENDSIMAEMLKLLAEKDMVASDMGKALDISTQKASSLAKLLVNEGKVEASDLKIKGKGSVKLYSLVVEG